MATLTAEEILKKYGVKITPQEKPPVTLLNVSKCSVLQIKEELEARNAYDETDAVAWKAFKDIETKLWLESYQTSKDKLEKALEAEREANGGTGGEPLTEMEESVKAGKLLTQEGALTFQDIEGWSMYELRQKMTEYDLMEDPKGEGVKAYKLFEELLSKLVRILLKGDSSTSGATPKPVPAPTAEELGEDFVSDSVVEKGAVKRTKNSETVEKMLAAVTVDSRVKVDPKDAKDFLKNPEFIPNIDDLTVDTAPKLSIYQLRQILERNNLFDDYKGGKWAKKKISHSNFLRTVMAYLVDKKEKENVVYAAQVEKVDDLKARLAEEKAKRKADAIERSRLRQIERKKREAEEAANKQLEESEAATAEKEQKPQPVEAVVAE